MQPAQAPSHDASYHQDKADMKPEIEMFEDAQKANGFQTEEADPNSPEAVLQRYPLLREMSEDEREKLNAKVRRRMDIWMLPMLTLMLFSEWLRIACLRTEADRFLATVNYLDRTNG